MPYVGVIYDDSFRPETTGTYVLRALQCLTDAVHLKPADLTQVDAGEFRLFVRVDDGLDYDTPAHLHPLAWWAIDTHLSFERCLRVARQADSVFAAQKNGAERLVQAGVPNAQWLPLACDPIIHGRRDLEDRYDVAFVGNFFPGKRAELLHLLSQSFPKSFLGKHDFRQMADIYSSAKVVFNCSLRDDLNMRVFEGLCSGALLITNDLGSNGQSELFQDGKHLVTYRSSDELIEKIDFYLKNEDERIRIATAGWNQILRNHTYLHRMQHLLRTVEIQATALESTPSRITKAVDEKVSACLISWKRPEQLRQIVDHLLQEPFDRRHRHLEQ